MNQMEKAAGISIYLQELLTIYMPTPSINCKT